MTPAPNASSVHVSYDELEAAVVVATQNIIGFHRKFTAWMKSKNLQGRDKLGKIFAETLYIEKWVS